MAEVLVRYVHFIAIIMLSASLVAEHLLLSVDQSKNRLRRLAVVDAIYGVSVLTVLTAGLLLWLVVGKPSPFYSQNWVFHLKLTLFGSIALLSIYPTLFFLRNRNKNPQEVTIPKIIINFVRVELTLLLFIPLCAVFMARGYGL
jgi:putative membrane protein